MQSGGNAIPLGKRKSTDLESVSDGSTDDSDSDGDSDAPLPGELESDDDTAEVDGGSDTSQLHLPTGGLDDADSMSDASSWSQGSDSDEDAPLAAEQQPGASRQKASAAVTKGQQQPGRLQKKAPSPALDMTDDDSDDDSEEAAAANDASRRNSHQVLQSCCTVCGIYNGCLVPHESVGFWYSTLQPYL